MWNQLRKKGLYGDDDAVRFRHPGECVSNVEGNLKNACLSELEKNNEEKGRNCTSGVVLATRHHFACVVAADGGALCSL